MSRNRKLRRLEDTVRMLERELLARLDGTTTLPILAAPVLAPTTTTQATTQATTTGDAKGMSEKKYNQMTMEKTVRLCDMLRAMQDKFSQEGSTNEEAADYLTKRLGFLVTERNVRSAREAIGVNWKVKNKRKTGRGYVGLLCSLCSAVTQIQKSLGINTDPAIEAYLSERNGHDSNHQGDQGRVSA